MYLISYVLTTKNLINTTYTTGTVLDGKSI